MNNIQELVERLTDMCATEEGSPWPHDVMQCLIDCRSLLQAPLPEDMDLGLPKCFRNGIAESPFYSEEERKLALWVCDELGKIYADLLERLQMKIETLECVNDNGSRQLKEARQRIEELEEVKQVIEGLDEAATFYVNRSPVATGEEIGLANKCQEGINMLERLWRENAALMDENVWLQKAQARIEVLEQSIPDAAVKIIDEQKACIEKLEEWQQAKYADKKVLIDRIEELSSERQNWAVRRAQDAETIERLDAALADADWLALKISEGNFNQAEVIKKSREFLKARAGE